MIDWKDAPAAVPEGSRIYAIGDIHGALGKLQALHGMIAADLEARPCAAPLLVHLGDYVDKGADPRGVVQHLMAGSPCPALHLRGNHEDMMLAALTGDASAVAEWLWCGGRHTVASWGWDAEAPQGWVPMPAERAFLEGTTLHHRAGGYLFVHAGIRPGVALEAQDPLDLMGIRHEFLNSEQDHGFVVVHGHTAGFAPVVKANRIALDTAAWSGGPLTCAVFEGERFGLMGAR
ncbi:metallophosphoesterase [Plastoroseomonas hellenica]|uniref:metallophosphoesterase n=1 Tax=Plastoroseomonas hellenica TaxID=2687306 RepID=UPI001BAB3ED2|nr:metallophosphoesterase [Plastoroseomonas hellenica]MBR0643927.1 serine/threonine protein phosphatase [Plastoroseomonas hellenica]